MLELNNHRCHVDVSFELAPISKNPLEYIIPSVVLSGLTITCAYTSGPARKALAYQLKKLATASTPWFREQNFCQD
jgi:hypothetical protein